MDATRDECLLLFRRVRVGFGFYGSCRPCFFTGISAREEWIPSHAKLGLLGGGPRNASIFVAVLIV
jgi:hypothetical protein